MIIANIWSTTISAQILHAGLLLREKTGAVAKHLLKQTADCAALQSQIDLNPHWTIDPLNQKSQIAH